MSSSKTKAVPQTLVSYDHKDLEEAKQSKHSDSVYQPLFLLPADRLRLQTHDMDHSRRDVSVTVIQVIVV